jgi:hypothetical protein
MNRFTIATIYSLLTLPLTAEANKLAEEQRIGAMVMEIDSALKAPSDAKSLATIVRYGTDSRHYVMIRGWLVQLLKGAESQNSAASEPELKSKHQEAVDFLKKAIRRIDLE